MDRDYRLSVALSSEEVGFRNVGSESEPLRRDRREFKRVGGSTGSVWVSSMFACKRQMWRCRHGRIKVQ